jgi:hypothetical protein
MGYWTQQKGEEDRNRIEQQRVVERVNGRTVYVVESRFDQEAS